LEPQWLEHTRNICNEFQANQGRWPIASWSNGRPRYLFNETGEDWSQLLEHVKDPLSWMQIEQTLDIKMQFSSASLWCDKTGFGSLMPHRETGGDSMAQIYITNQPHDWSGTTVYNEEQQILFQMPYRDNYSWFFDDGKTVMHGRHHDVPPGIDRFTLQIWWNRL